MTKKETKMKMTITTIPPNPITFTLSTAATLYAPLVVPQCLLQWSRMPVDSSLTTVCARFHKVSSSSLQRLIDITCRHI